MTEKMRRRARRSYSPHQLIRSKRSERIASNPSLDFVSKLPRKAINDLW